MRAPKRRRPHRRRCAAPSADINLANVAARVTYVGSSEHKTFPSFAGPPKPRSDASRCDPHLADPDVLTGWLREAITTGQVGELWEGDFPPTRGTGMRELSTRRAWSTQDSGSTRGTPWKQARSRRG